MKKILVILITVICSAAGTQAQTFIEHLQKSQQGQGTVTVTQSKDIDELVNGKQPAQTAQPADSRKETVTDKNRTDTKTEPERNGNIADTKEDNEEEAHKPERKYKGVINETNSASEETITDTRKKVALNSRKVTGYRVQVYSGGNKRTDREKANQAGMKVKQSYPNLPLYTHFYSPSWKCRVGNFRTYAEAEKVLKQVKALGFKNAVIVKDKISVY